MVKGLSYAEVEKSRRRYGTNAITERRKNSFFKKLFKNLADPIIKVLIGALVVTLLFGNGDGNLFESLGIAIAIAVSTLVSTLSEYGSEKAFAKMQAEAFLQTCKVIREGNMSEIPISEIVVGDVIYLTSGDKIAADGFLSEGAISCDVSALNGESAEQQKKASAAPTEKKSVSDCSSLFRGSAVTQGNGYMTVTAIGDSTYFGQMAVEVQQESEESPLREKMTRFALTLSRFGYICAVGVAIAYLVNAVLLSAEFVFTLKNLLAELLHAITLAVSVVVVAVPEGLPMMITVVLSSNMIKMQKQNVRVRKPVGIETAGSVNILFTDKTGTLTYGAPRVCCYISGGGEKAIRAADMPEAQRELFGLCAAYASGCDLSVSLRNGRKSSVGGNGTDIALLDGALSCGQMPCGVKRTAFLPFDSGRKMMAASVSLEGNAELARRYGKNITLIKGAPEMLLKKCRYYYGGDGSRKELKLSEVTAQLDEMMKKGIRCIGVFTGTTRAENVKNIAESAIAGEMKEPDVLCEGLTLVCIVGVRDELRKEARRSVSSLTSAGVQIVMMTGDSKGTAVAIAKECGILSGDSEEIILTGDELSKMTDEEVGHIIEDIRVIARALPGDKSRLVRIAKNLGYVTAMTGDGLNDAPALKAADVGFAMGNGTEVAKEAGDIIIEDSNISSIERAVLYGRTILKSIRKFAVFQLTMNLCAVGVSIIGPFIGIENPVTVVQMLWINMIIDTLAALAFAGEAPKKRYMKEKPVPRDEAVLNGDMITRIFVMGVYTVTLCVYYLTSFKIRVAFGGSIESIVFLSGFFALFVFCGIFGAFNARTERLNLFAGLMANPVFIIVMAAVFVAQIGMLYFGGSVFRTAPLSLGQLETVTLISVTVLPVGRFLELLLRKKR